MRRKIDYNASTVLVIQVKIVMMVWINDADGYEGKSTIQNE
jgi:hypothetical protein